jgi:hypothetical protein
VSPAVAVKLPLVPLAEVQSVCEATLVTTGRAVFVSEKLVVRDPAVVVMA